MDAIAWGILISVFVVNRIPIVGKFFSVTNTMIHETGHALVSLLTNGVVYQISLFSNKEGVAETGHRSWIGRVVTTYAGYTFSSLMAYLFFHLISVKEYDWILFTLISIVVINLLLWVRNVYGIAWLIAFGSLLGYLLYIPYTVWVHYGMIFISGIILVESIYTAFVIMVLSFTRPHDAGDATNLAKATFLIPAFMWGTLFFVQSLYAGYKVFQLFCTI